MPFIRKKRLWSKGKEGSYLVSPSVGRDSNNQRRDTEASISSASSLASLEATDDSKKHQRSRESSLGDAYGSLDSLEDAQVWDSISMEDQAVRLISSHRRQSVAPEQIQVEINDEEAAEKPRKGLDSDDHHVDPIDEETAAHVRKVVASIMKKYDKLEMTDSDSSTVASENSDLQVSSDEESDVDDGKEVFDFHAHIKKICKRDDGSDSESDDNESVTSEKAFKTAVRRAMKKIKRERSVESDKGSEKGSETEEQSPKSDDDTSSEQDGEESESSSTENEKASFEMARDVDPEIQELMKGGLVIDPKKGQNDAHDSRIVYRYFKNNEGKIESVPDTVDNLSDDADGPPTGNPQEDNLASTLEHSKAEDLRWPYSNYYVKEINQEAFHSENCDALPSYRSTQASASHPGRKRNVMLGRVWWVEWWAKEDTKMKSTDDSSPSL